MSSTAPLQALNKDSQPVVRWPVNCSPNTIETPHLPAQECCDLYALDMDKAVDRVTSGCHSCAALCQTPTVQQEQTSSAPPEAVDQAFAVDVIKRN